MRGLHPLRFDREAAAMCGSLSPCNWENELFGKMAEAVEITAVQRGVERWEPGHMPVLVALPERPAPPPLPHFIHSSPLMYVTEEAHPDSEGETRKIVLKEYADVAAEAFVRYLPVVAALAAGEPLNGFDVGGLEWAAECSWVAVPTRLAGRNRFVIQVTGDSMTPTLNRGDLVVFEYHRSPRGMNQVVIANLTTFGIESSAHTTGAVKRLMQDANTWIFHSDNPAYQDISVTKAECQYPILGVLVGTLQHAPATPQASVPDLQTGFRGQP